MHLHFHLLPRSEAQRRSAPASNTALSSENSTAFFPPPNKVTSPVGSTTDMLYVRGLLGPFTLRTFGGKPGDPRVMISAPDLGASPCIIMQLWLSAVYKAEKQSKGKNLNSKAAKAKSNQNHSNGAVVLIHMYEGCLHEGK
jgi:hypothetical protein